jgi:hypothetical protein
MDLYRRIDALPAGPVNAAGLAAIEVGLDRYPGEWLLRAELLWRSGDCRFPQALLDRLRHDLEKLGEAAQTAELAALIGEAETA